LLSVLIAIYRGTKASEFQLCLQSLADQTVPANEIVVVADGPVTPDVEDILKGMVPSLPIKVVRLEANRGLGAALHMGLSGCSFPLVARIDSDDMAYPHRFERQLAAFDATPELDILGSFASEIDESGRLGPLRTMPTSHADIVSCLWANPIIHPAVMFRRDKIIQAGSYDQTLRRRQDYELWFRCAEAGLQFANLAEPLLYYRFSQETHKRQRPSDLWRQALIGMSGSRRLGLPLLAQIGCFVPFFRSLLPIGVQHQVYIWMAKIDPRKQR
jgi:glycosyltransferase involved in cell wall biosynthesis